MVSEVATFGCLHPITPAMGIRRVTKPGTLCHVIIRFTNGEYRIIDRVEREEYLRRFEDSLSYSDWLALGYCLMSTHIHFALLVGTNTFSDLFRPVHSAFAPWLNRRQGRMGPLLARRPDTYELRPEMVGPLLAYQHNNPVRAGVVKGADDSNWTSHLAYQGVALAPEWLEVELGLKLAGFDASPEGRKAFAHFVEKQLECPDDLLALDPQSMREHRRNLRQVMSTAIELGSPRLDPNNRIVTYPTWSMDGVPVHQQKFGARVALEAVCRETGVDVELVRSSSRVRRVSAARRLAVLIANDHLGCTRREIAAWLGITPEAARFLARSADDGTRERASRIAVAIRDAEGE